MPQNEAHKDEYLYGLMYYMSINESYIFHTHVNKWPKVNKGRSRNVATGYAKIFFQ